jgi:hypothetical protein
MKRPHFIFRSILAALLLAGVLPAQADESFPLPPEPKWWAQTGLTDVRYGQWLPCRTEWNISNDCLQAINIYKLDGTSAGSLTYKPTPGFDPKTAVQEWQLAKTPTGEMIENYSDYKDGFGIAAYWTLPDGIKNTDGSTEVHASIHLMNGSLQIYLLSNDMLKGSLPEGYYFEFVVKSAGFSKKIKWVLSNVSDPQIKVSGDLITVKGLPDKSPSARADDQVCEPNELKALSSQRNMAVNMIYYEPGRASAATNPDDVILGTNGWWCLSNFGFDKETQQIVVKVGNVHYDENGLEIQGWMELKIKGARARDWWGMDPAIASQYAKVEITYQNGTSKLATVTSNYDAKNDWINLRAYGFTYSTPQLAVSFKKPAEAITPIAETKPPAKVTPKKTITCVKGKTVKKVTAVAPKCPAGYKKK